MQYMDSASHCCTCMYVCIHWLHHCILLTPAEEGERWDTRDLHHEVQQSSGEDKEETAGAAGVLLDGCPQPPPQTLWRQWEGNATIM